MYSNNTKEITITGNVTVTGVSTEAKQNTQITKQDSQIAQATLTNTYIGDPVPYGFVDISQALKFIYDANANIDAKILTLIQRPKNSNITQVDFSNATVAGLIAAEAVYLAANPDLFLVSRTMVATATTFDSVLTFSAV